MFVAASAHCLSHMPLDEAMDLLVHLQFTAVELPILKEGKFLTPADVHADLQEAVLRCRETHRLDICALLVDLGEANDEAYNQFHSICKLAKALKVHTITVPSAELGTPFNEEVEHLGRLVAIAGMEGIRVSIKNETGRISQDPDTLKLLCNHVDGLGITLDPSHFVYGPHGGVDYDPLLKFVYHTHLRDTRKDELQVRVGQGEIEYGRLVSQLQREGYDRALCVDIYPVEGEDAEQHAGELRKLRLLLESLLL